jgi:predicted amidohydrolase
MKPELACFEANVAKMEGFIDDIMRARAGTDLIVFPELATSGYECTKDEFAALAEHIGVNGDARGSLARIGAKCRQYGVHVVYGLPEADSRISGIYYNSMVLLGTDGSVLGSYRKVHPFDTEKQWCRPGSAIKTVDTPFGRVGMMICWDTAFPEVARAYALQGADLLIVATNWESPYADDWDLVTKARAFDNTLHLVSANRVGFDKTLGFFGHSNIVSPLGKVIASLDEEVEGIVHAEIDLGLTERLRREYYTLLKDRQPHCYGDLLREY